VSTEDVKGIFGNIVDILEVHNKIKVCELLLLGKVGVCVIRNQGLDNGGILCVGI